MDDLIRRRATGSPEKFAERLGIKKTMLMEELQELRSLGAEVKYCKTRESYEYANKFLLKIGVEANEQNSIKGGQNYMEEILPVQYCRTDLAYF